MKPGPNQVVELRKQVEEAIKASPHLKDRKTWLRAGREYPQDTSDFPQELKDLPKNKLHFLVSRLRHKLYRCALVDLTTAEILAHAPNYTTMLGKVQAYKPPDLGLMKQTPSQ